MKNLEIINDVGLYPPGGFPIVAGGSEICPKTEAIL